MSFRWYFGTAALAAALVWGEARQGGTAEIEGRAALAGRQQIRAELAAAMADGYLSRQEQYTILLHAKEVLSTDDLHGLERTLDRLAAASDRGGGGDHSIPSVDDRLVAGGARRVGYESSQPNPSAAGLNYEEPDGAVIPANPYQQAGPRPVPSPYGDMPGSFSDGEVFSNDGCMVEEMESRCRHSFLNVDVFSSVDAFKGPIDLNEINHDGNFGFRVGVNGAIPIVSSKGLGFQVGTSELLSDFKGTPLTGSEDRDQRFTTAGFFQRIPTPRGSFGYGFVYDWLRDNYYTKLKFGQWRVKLAWEKGPCDELGIWAAIPDHGASGDVFVISPITGEYVPVPVRFRPEAQGSIYWRHTWWHDISTTSWLGVAQRPGEFVFGSDAKIPISPRLSLVGTASYILPNAAGIDGQNDEMWNVGVGIEFVPGGRGCCHSQFAPFMPVADNGSFATRQTNRDEFESILNP
ncbi:MAG: DUF4148 domain-containing protein [Thermoguttaceae bacterium]|jgi:hypothetical protein